MEGDLADVLNTLVDKLPGLLDEYAALVAARTKISVVSEHLNLFAEYDVPIQQHTPAYNLASNGVYLLHSELNKDCDALREQILALVGIEPRTRTTSDDDIPF